jgi:hypothetical protein
VVRLDLVEIKERAEEVARWKAEAAKEMRPEDDAFVVLRRRRGFCLGRDAHLHIRLSGQPTCLAEKGEVVFVNVGAIPIAGL